MENGKKYSVIELAEQLGVPRTTINDWLGKYSSYIDFAVQGKRRVYTDASLAVLREISALRTSGMSSADIETELAKRHPLRAEPAETPQPEQREQEGSPVLQEPAAENTGYQLIAQKQSEEIGRMIGDAFQDMADRMKELEKLSRERARRTWIWIGISSGLFVLLLAGIFFASRQLERAARANEAMRSETKAAGEQLAQLRLQSAELIAGSKDFKENIALLERELKGQKKAFEENIQTIRKEFEQARKEQEQRISEEQQKHAAALRMKDAELSMEKEKFAGERLKLLQEIERGKTEKESTAGNLKQQEQPTKSLSDLQNVPIQASTPTGNDAVSGSKEETVPSDR